MTDEKRRFARKPIDVKVYIGESNEAGRFWFDSQDISAAGVYLVSDFLLEEEEEITMELTLPNAGRTIRVAVKI